ncbi:fatty acid desaturase [Aestuariivirga sp.]|uniref:fatty acid desaturase n=1 Tax=Aestuariivirga sp. TaxID=2650926 RepID=UPI0039E5A8E8
MMRRSAIEWPTLALIAADYAVLALIVWHHAMLPWWIILPIGACCAALHTSLQHEVLHGHPTRSRVLNEALIFVTPTFWLPFPRYRETHLIHHNDAHLTDPARDPESYYLLPEDWNALPGLKQRLYRLNNTLAGRMIMGPAISIIRFWSSEFAAIARGDAPTARAWAYHAAASALTIFLISGVAGMPLWQYLLLIAYPGIGLALVRSFCEHQAAERPEHRTIIVEASTFWSLLFLNNNLHVAHHVRPALPWYQLPAYYRAERTALIARNNGYLMKGYHEIFARWFLTPKEPVPYPHPEWLKD